jgi:hypothetical protein
MSFFTVRAFFFGIVRGGTTIERLSLLDATP